MMHVEMTISTACPWLQVRSATLRYAPLLHYIFTRNIQIDES